MAVLVLILAAVGSLVASLLTHHIWPAWCALALCLAGLCLIAARTVYARRAPSPETAADEAEATSETDGEAEDEVEAAPAPAVKAAPAAEAASAAGGASAAEAAEPGELVRIVKGRRRFHAPDCRVLAARARDREVEYDEITRDEALDDGLTPCGVCGGGAGSRAASAAAPGRTPVASRAAAS